MSHRIESPDFNRSFGALSSSTIGSYIASFTIVGTNLGGYVCNPFTISPILNRAQPVRVYIAISPAANSVEVATNVQLDLAITQQAPGLPRVETTIVQLQAIPNPWTTADLIRVLLDNGAGYTFAPNVLDPGTMLGLRITRNGPAAADTWTGSLKIASALDVDYLTLYPWEGCC